MENRSVMSEQGNRIDPKLVMYATVAVIICVAFVVGLFIGRYQPKINSDGTISTASPNRVGSIFNLLNKDSDNTEVKDIDFDLYWEVWEMMENEYVDPSKVDQSAMFYDSIKGMVNSYGDPATIFLDPEDTNTFNQNSAGNYFSGIGAELGYQDGQIVVISPIEGSPAKAAGIRPGDIIVAVDGVAISSSENIYDVVMKIRGEKGTEVTITILRSGSAQTEDITIVRGDINVPSMGFAVGADPKIGVIDISRFTEASLAEWNQEWNSKVDEFLRSDAELLIIDLRGNPGGYFDAAVYASGEFLVEDTIVSKQEDRSGKIKNYEVKREGKLLNVPVVVLVNEGSASASEILAGALQVNDRAHVIGVNTFGKGTAQSVVDFPDGSSLHITVMKWLLPDGSWLNNENPIKPDQVVELTEEDFLGGRDPQMDAAVKYLLEL